MSQTHQSWHTVAKESQCWVTEVPFSLAPQSWSVDQQHGHQQIEMNRLRMHPRCVRWESAFLTGSQVTLTYIRVWAAVFYNIPSSKSQHSLSLNSCWDWPLTSSRGSPFRWTALMFRKFHLLSSQNLPVGITHSVLPHRSPYSRCLGVSSFSNLLCRSLDPEAGWAVSGATQGQLPVTWQRPAGPEMSSKEQNPCSLVSSTRVQGRWFKRLQFGELEKVFQKDESI